MYALWTSYEGRKEPLHGCFASDPVIWETRSDIFVRISGCGQSLTVPYRGASSAPLFSFCTAALRDKFVRLKAESDDGGWYPNVADHYRYALSQPEVSGVLCSFLQPAHLDELLAGLDDGALTIEQQQRFEMLAGWG